MSMSSSAPSARMHELVAGSLRVRLSGTDLVGVRWRGREIAQRIYVAVRDAPWNTIPGVIEDLEVSQDPEHFAVTFRCRHHFGEIDFEWRGTIEGTSDGTLSYRLAGHALREFEYSKIGFNLHHPLEEYRNRGYLATTENGQALTGQLPSIIEPQLIRNGTLTAMFDEFRHITFDLDGLSASFSFEGDDFEMQDHRNWADANYKTYGTSMKRGFPFTAHRGDRFEQGIVLTIGDEGSADSLPAVPIDSHLVFEKHSSGLPQIGQLWAPSERRDERKLPPPVRPDFLRVEVDRVGDVVGALDDAGRLFSPKSVPIELVLSTTPEDAAEDASTLANALRDGVTSSASVIRVVVLERAAGFSATKVATPAALVSDFVGALRAADAALPVLSGTEQNFNEINRSRPEYEGLDGIAFSYNPQVHAADDVSLMQNAATIVDIADSTRALYPGTSLSVGPVHLLGPNGPYPAGPAGPGEPSVSVDGRQRGLFGAAWTVAFLRSCVAARVDAVTLFSLSGEGGTQGTPIGWVLQRLQENSPTAGSKVSVSDPFDDRVAGIRWTTNSGSCAVVANLSDEELVIGAEGLLRDSSDSEGSLPDVTIRLLDDSFSRPDAGASEGEAVREASLTPGATVSLKPYAVLFIKRQMS